MKVQVTSSSLASKKSEGCAVVVITKPKYNLGPSNGRKGGKEWHVHV